ncbi:unnamed protein product, partial [Symbiodinium sp. CCMP2456]
AATGQQDLSLLASAGGSSQGRQNDSGNGLNQLPNPKKTKEDKPKKQPNFASKANAKIKTGRSTVTDAKYWKRVIIEDGKSEKPKASAKMIDGYLSQIDFHMAPVQNATEALDMKCVEGSKDEKTLKPMMETLQSAIDDYTAAIKAIKTLYASWCTASYVLIWVNSCIQSTEIAASFNYLFLGVCPTKLDVVTILPEDVSTDPKEVARSGEVMTLPRATLTEIRADWKFHKAAWVQ